jgi:hypothetical protein
MDTLHVSSEAHEQIIEQDKAGHDRRGSLHDETDEDGDSCTQDVVESVKPGEDDRVRTASMR